MSHQAQSQFLPSNEANEPCYYGFAYPATNDGPCANTQCTHPNSGFHGPVLRQFDSAPSQENPLPQSLGHFISDRSPSGRKTEFVKDLTGVRRVTVPFAYIHGVTVPRPPG